MIIYENKGFQTRSDCPCSDWTGQAKYVVPDGGELAEQILSLYPYYDFVEQDGVLTGVVAVAPPALTAEELHLRYEARTVELVRERYTSNDEAKVIREYLAEVEGGAEAFQAYNSYVISCKEQSYLETYGTQLSV